MGKQKNCKGVKKSYEAEIKFPVRKICAHCGKRMTRDYFDIPEYQLDNLEFCSQQCYSNYINKVKLEELKVMSTNQRKERKYANSKEVRAIRK
jgi:hypothetical protein